MSNIAIKVENLSKAYQLGQIGTGTISRDLERFFVTKILRKEDPFLTIGQTNDRTAKGNSDIVWSLKDINFEVNQGEAIGIIGRNGAGKSTLLKLLSRVTSPTTGSIKIKGRVASLLEVGTGFHPELSGRENIFLNGAILGMRKQEIKRKFDEIVDFAGVERYIDTPVKRYSSGMYVRLAFAVAAHLESEILIVDEVLAVGDAEFQKKCIGKMGDVSRGEGRTVLFVSHNMASVKELCKTGIVLHQGAVQFVGTQTESIQVYQQNSDIIRDSYFYTSKYFIENDSIKVNSFIVESLLVGEITVNSGFKFTIDFIMKNNEKEINVDFELRSIDENILFYIPYIFRYEDLNKERYSITGFIDGNILNAGIYKFNIVFGKGKFTSILKAFDVVQFEILNSIYNGITDKLPGITRPNIRFLLNEED